ncbi:hypothetical protein 1 [Hubei polero-like virus 2]|uniref:hypothetical protein 1 n=1 Tax=Hubei polero-like virus 2 TaxID=1923170 RepID=UPI00090AEB4B|nr:hypothetical protein 1 [Hubei polero-like virus 2]APG75785.1 hypothetical protein 1 [Hubei polero-like virus 2]
MNIEVLIPGYITVTKVINRHNHHLNAAAFLRNICYFIVNYPGLYDVSILSRSIAFVLPLFLNRKCRFTRSGLYKVPRSQARAYLEWGLYIGFFPEFVLSPDGMLINLREPTTEGAYRRELRSLIDDVICEGIRGHPECIFLGPEHIGKILSNVVRYRCPDVRQMRFNSSVDRGVILAATGVGDILFDKIFIDPSDYSLPLANIAYYLDQIDHEYGSKSIWKFTILDSVCQLLSPEETLSESCVQQELYK